MASEHDQRMNEMRASDDPGEFYDITGKIGPLFTYPEKPEWPMYSYSHAAAMVWNAVAGEFKKAGWSDKKIKEWLQSKNARWALDGELGDALLAAGRDYARKELKGR